MRLPLFFLAAALPVLVSAETAEVLPEVTVFSPRVANQAPVATFAMPVSALRFEPRVDVQARNFAEGQADVAIRGGIFENTGFRIGGLSLFDPQTGHYFAEIPIAPAMLGAPQIVTGPDLALQSTNATVGAVASSWRRIRDTGHASIGAGEFNLFQAELYQGYVRSIGGRGASLGADIAWAHSESDGAVTFGDHQLDRINGRLQFVSAAGQTDLFAGYQAKFFGWPNLYTPFNSPESENLKTLLLLVNHRADLGGGDFVEAGFYHRRNVDDYRFNRFAAVPPYLYLHTSWVDAAALSARRDLGAFVLNGRAEFLADDLSSTTLTHGRYRSRSLAKLALLPEKTFALADGARLVVKAGATYDDSNRTGGRVSPVFEIAREKSSASLPRLYFSYAETTQLPTYTALNSDATSGLFRGNPNLGREVTRNVELGATAVVAGWSAQAALFYRRDDDLVDWTFRHGVTARTASPVDIATTGLELVAQRSWRHIDLVLGYTWLEKSEDYGATIADASFYALNFAKHRLTLAVVARLTSELELRLDNEARLQADNLLRTAGGDEPLLSSIGLSYRPQAFRRFVFTVQADNLWDSDFQEVPAVPASPRQVSATVAFSW
ncbi:MAG TPA: TonB-dependent receptor [Opitutus sp.]|nr:TonB-dependent receptor [Opitutus sp.]